MENSREHPMRCCAPLKASDRLEKSRPGSPIPALASRQPAYMLLLGVVGDAPERKVVETQLASQADAHEAGEPCGPDCSCARTVRPVAPRVDRGHLPGGQASQPAEIEGALPGSQRPGNRRRTIPRASIVSAYRRFIVRGRTWPPSSPQDLSDWQAVEAVDDMEAAIRSGAIRIRLAIRGPEPT